MREDALGPWEKALAALALALPVALVLADLTVLHPGYGMIDETAGLRGAWEMAQGRSVPWGLGRGNFNFWLRGICMRALGPDDASPSLLSIAAFLAEAFLLSRLARRFFGERVALGALLFHGLSALAMVRLRTPLAWAVAPLEALVVFSLLLEPRPWLQALGAFLAPLFLLDYEGWLGGLVALAFCAPFLRRQGARIPWILAGLALGALTLGLLGGDSLQSHLVSRMTSTVKTRPPGGQGWGANLLSLLRGGGALPGVGIRNWPGLPPWSWPFLALGAWAAWREGRWVLVWAAAGCLMLLPPTIGDLLEPQRAVSAWPAFALAAGLGWRQIHFRLPRFGAGIAIALALVGAASEARAFLAGQRDLDGHYSAWQSSREAGRWLERRYALRPVHLIDSLGVEPSSEIDWLGSRARRSPSGEPVAVIPWIALPALPAGCGELFRFDDRRGRAGAYLLIPSPAFLPRLLAAEREYAPFNHLPGSNYFAQAASLEAVLDGAFLREPLARAAAWERLLNIRARLGNLDPALVDRLEREKPAHAGPWYFPSYIALRSDPGLADRMHSLALRMDPRLAPLDERNGFRWSAP